jgi:hypothetical protein
VVRLQPVPQALICISDAIVRAMLHIKAKFKSKKVKWMKVEPVADLTKTKYAIFAP